MSYLRGPTVCLCVGYTIKGVTCTPSQHVTHSLQMTSLEPFWVITTVVSEANLERRVKIIKKMIKVASELRRARRGGR